MRPALFFLTFLVGSLLLPLHARSEEYAFLLRAKGNPYWATVAQGISETGKALGKNVLIYNTSNETAAEEQINTCMSVIARKPKVITVSAATPSSGIQCLKRASEAGILVAELDSTIPIEEADSAGVKLSFSVGSNNRLIGQRAGEYAASIFSGKAPKLLILEGAVGNPAARDRAQGFVLAFTTMVPDADIEAAISADWDRLKAMNITTDVLQRTSQIDLIYAANDQMALGAVEAVRTFAPEKRPRIIGVDGIADARKAVSDGRLEATVAQLPYLIGKRAVELSVEAAKGGLPQTIENTPTPVLTKKVLELNSAPELAYVK
jgi:D-allose transport system substrate-binding protein